MDGVTGMLAWLSHVPVGSRVGLYWPANIDFRFVSHLRLQRAGSASPSTYCPAELSASRTAVSWAIGVASMSVS